MIAPLEVVTGMELTPNECVLCANNPVDDVTGEQQPAIFAPGVDVNWGNSVYICWSCVNIMADLADRVDHDTHQKLKEEHETLEESHEKLKREHTKAKALLDRIRDGQSAVKEARGGKPAKKEKVS